MKVVVHGLTKEFTTGQGKMKAVAGLSDQQAADIIAHLRTLK